MIIDNIDSAEAFFKEKVYGMPLAEYVPDSTKGSVLYTSRNGDIGVDLTQDRDPIAIPSMSSGEARHLLGKDLISSSTDEGRRICLKNWTTCLLPSIRPSHTRPKDASPFDNIWKFSGKVTLTKCV